MSAKSVGYYQEADMSAARTLADVVGADVPASSDYCIVQAKTKACRWRSDGTAPTASVGNYLADGDTLIVRRSQYGNFQIIEVAASAELNVEFFKTG